MSLECCGKPMIKRPNIRFCVINVESYACVSTCSYSFHLCAVCKKLINGVGENRIKSHIMSTHNEAFRTNYENNMECFVDNSIDRASTLYAGVLARYLDKSIWIDFNSLMALSKPLALLVPLTPYYSILSYLMNNESVGKVYGPEKQRIIFGNAEYNFIIMSVLRKQSWMCIFCDFVFDGIPCDNMFKMHLSRCRPELILY